MGLIEPSNASLCRYPDVCVRHKHKMPASILQRRNNIFRRRVRVVVVPQLFPDNLNGLAGMGHGGTKKAGTT